MRRLTLFLAFTLASSAQSPVQPTPAPQHEANFDAKRAQANKLVLEEKYLEALPLYADLCRQDQTNPAFAERYGIGLIKKAGTLPEGPEKKALNEQAFSELYRAQKLGDNSPLLQSILATQTKSGIGVVLANIPLTVGYTHKPDPQAKTILDQAEIAFNKNDLDAALPLYQQAAQLDPAWYAPDLYAGDVAFRQNKPDEAEAWLKKAISIDPNRETAYRYLGDVLLLKLHDLPAAKLEYEQAVIAEPYNKATTLGLQKWAAAAHQTYSPPQVTRPGYQTDHGVLVPNPTLAVDTATGRADWLLYAKVRIAHGGLTPGQFIVAGGTSATGVLTPSGYRHSLTEEMDSLTTMLSTLRQQLKEGTVSQSTLDPSLKTLLELQSAELLEPWILLTVPDAGLRQDYFTYRPAHRAQLKAYLDQYMLHEQKKP
jgi:tetratricopeptide (TPR) repeat protein